MLPYGIALHMILARNVVLILSSTIVACWFLAWLPPDVLPNSLHWLFFWFGGLLTIFLVPAFVGIWWGLSRQRDPKS